MKIKIFVGGSIFLFLISCTIAVNKNMGTVDFSRGDVTVPVVYVGGNVNLKKVTEGNLSITNTTTRFVSEKGIVHFDLPISTISGVYVGDEVRRHFGRTLAKLLLSGLDVMFRRDKLKVIAIEFTEKQKNTVVNSIFLMKFGSGLPVQKNIQTKHKFAITKMHWETTRTADTISAYEEFLKQHSDSEFADDARWRLNIIKKQILKEHWEVTVTADSISAYEKFIIQHPDSEYTEEARLRLITLKKESPKKHWMALNRTISGYEDFLNFHPDSEYAEEARLRLDLLKKEAAKKHWLTLKKTVSDYEDFLNQHPNSEYDEEARLRLDLLKNPRPLKVIAVKDEHGNVLLQLFNFNSKPIALKTYLYKEGRKVSRVIRETDGTVLHTIELDASGREINNMFICLDKDGKIIKKDGKPILVKPFYYTGFTNDKVASTTVYGGDGRAAAEIRKIFRCVDCKEKTGIKNVEYVW